MLWAAADGDLEVRREPDGSTRLRGSFPYGGTAVLSDGGRTGRPRKERIAPHAFRFAVEAEDMEISLLGGHNFDRPLASKRQGSLTLRDTASALIFDAIVSRAVAETTHGRDVLALIGAGLATGISPGFRMPPERAVPREEAETIEEEPDNPENGEHRAIIRTIRQAILVELSVVARPAYPEAQVEARCWMPSPPAPVRRHATLRWR